MHFIEICFEILSADVAAQNLTRHKSQNQLFNIILTGLRFNSLQTYFSTVATECDI